MQAIQGQVMNRRSAEEGRPFGRPLRSRQGRAVRYSPNEKTGFIRRLGANTTCLLLLAVFILGTWTQPALANTPNTKATEKQFAKEELKPLMTALEEVGFSRESLERVFYDSRLKKIDRVVGINALNPDSPNIYAQFTEPYAIHIAHKFLRRNLSALKSVEEQYGVPKEIIVGILLVETQFGRAHLPYRVLDVFTTLAVEAHPSAINRHYQRLKGIDPRVKKDWLTERLIKKAEFAFTELVAIMAMHRENLSRLFHVRGSYAGAIGIPQFLPSSYILFAVDGNGDGKRDLNQLPDALASVGNYLASHGWTEEAHFDDLWRSVWSYNRSENYVRAIFEVAFKLQKPLSKRAYRPRKPKA